MSEKNSRQGPILLNALPIQAGGGLQKTITLLRTFKSENVDASGFTVIARRGTELERVARESGFKVITSGRSTFGRLLFEVTARIRFSRGTLCFTLSGPPMLTTAGYFLNVVECAYSNLLYPEINFWGELSGIRRLRKDIVDFYRRKALKSADIWVFQTRILARRASELVGLPRERVYFVSTAPNTNVTPDRISVEVEAYYNRKIPRGTRLLFLSGANPNKRVHLFPKILRYAISNGLRDAVVITTLPESSFYARKVADAFADLDLEDRYCNIGPVPPADVPSVISCCDSICTLSLLESFSNNFIEAWAMRKPLIASRSDWAMDVAGQSAVFVDVRAPESAGHEIAALLTSKERCASIVKLGAERLDKFSTPERKLEEYLGVMAASRLLGPCHREQRASILW